jgi:hypothetical protein
VRSDFIQSDIQDAAERRRQPVAAHGAAAQPTGESFASILMDPRETAHMKTLFRSQTQVAEAPSGTPVSPFRGVSAFTGSPALIPSAVVPPIDVLTDTGEITPTAAPSPVVEAAPLETIHAASAAPTAPQGTGRREPVAAFAAAKTETPAPVRVAERVQGNAAYGAAGLSAEEAIALADGHPSSIPQGPKLFGDEGMTLADFFSVINPLQHLPLVGAVYREITGDTIKPGARVLGGLLFGGPMGMVGGAFNAGVAHDIGTDPGGALIALAQGRSINQNPENLAATAALAAAPRPVADTVTADTTVEAAPVTMAQSSDAKSSVAAPLSLAAPRLSGPTRPSTGGTAAEARIIAPSQVSPVASPAALAQPAADASKAQIPVSFAASPAAGNTTVPVSSGANSTGFAVNSGGKEFAVPARMNNVQPRQPVPMVRSDISRSKELAPMAPLTARPEAPRPDRSTAPATLLTPGFIPSGQTPSGLTATSQPPVVAAPLGVPGLPASALPDAMTRALDKYDALIKSRKGGVLNQQS